LTGGFPCLRATKGQTVFPFRDLELESSISEIRFSNAGLCAKEEVPLAGRPYLEDTNGPAQPEERWLLSISAA